MENPYIKIAQDLVLRNDGEFIMKRKDIVSYCLNRHIEQTDINREFLNPKAKSDGRGLYDLRYVFHKYFPAVSEEDDEEEPEEDENVDVPLVELYDDADTYYDEQVVESYQEFIQNEQDFYYS